ncbi:MAG: hypothetical protein IIZ02_05890 [Desulfovibrio sp.]|nr:hypothetical protein [Desulfovibrio sp.]
MEQAREKTSVMPLVHTLIGLAIMFSGHFLPCLSLVAPADQKLLGLGFPQVDGGVLLSVTHTGMVVSMIFFGVIYLWTFVDTIWPGLLGIVALIFSGFAPAPKVLQMFLGNPMVVMIFFLLIVAAAIVYSNLAEWIARYLMSREFINGRPWIFTATILLTTYLVAFLDQPTACFLMWPVLFSIFKAAGFKKGDTYVSVMTVYIAIMALLSFASDPFKGGAFYLLSNLHSLAANDAALHAPELNTAVYLLFGLAISLCSIAFLMLMMRFVFRVDVAPLAKLDPSVLNKEPLPPMNAMQKLVLFDFLLYATWLLLPAVIGKGNVVGAFMAKHHMAGSLLAVLLLTVVFVKRKPVVDITVSNRAYPWRVFLLIAVAMLLGGVMTGKGTNVSLFMEYGLRDLLGGMHYITFTIAVCLIGIVFTNFCNSVVLGLVLTPVLISVANAFGMGGGPMMACFIYAVLIAACTPAASPFAALLFGNTEWVDQSLIIRYSVIASLCIFLVVCTVGLPLAMMLF